MTRRLQVLVSAYQCAPGEGSVSQIGWEWYWRLAQQASVTLVTHIRNRCAIEGQPRPAPDSQVIYIDTEAFAGPLYRIAERLFPRSQHSVFLISSLDFFAFDRKAVRVLRLMQRSGHNWDVVHCVTPVSPVASPTLHRLGAPVILGPWNGGLKSPTTFREFMKQDSSWLYPLRNLGYLAELTNHGIENAALVLVATDATRKSLPQRYTKKSYSMLENGVDLEKFRATSWPIRPSTCDPLRVLFVGRLLPFKGVAMLLDAVKKVSSSIAVELRVVGDGPERDPLEKQAASLGISEMVRFCGNQSLGEVADQMQRAHVFCLPSVRESGGAVLLEAMASARPVIAVNYGGPAELVTEEIGHAIPPTSRQSVVEDLVETLLSVAQNPEEWRLKGLAGRRRAEAEFSWAAKVERSLLLYREVVTARGTTCRADGLRAGRGSTLSFAGESNEVLRTGK